MSNENDDVPTLTRKIPSWLAALGKVCVAVILIAITVGLIIANRQCHRFWYH